MEREAIRGAGLLGEARQRRGAGVGVAAAARHGAHGVAAQQQLADELATDVARAACDGGDFAGAGEGGGHDGDDDGFFRKGERGISSCLAWRREERETQRAARERVAEG